MATKEPTTTQTATAAPPAAPGKDSNAAMLLAAAAAENKDPLRVDETLSRIERHPGVLGALIINHDGVVIRSSMDNVQTIQYTTLMNQLAGLAKSVVRDLDPENDLRILRLRTKKHEIMISQAKHYLIIVVQNPDDQ